MKLVDNAKFFYRMASVRVASVFGVFALLPETKQEAVLDLVGLPMDKLPAIMAVVFIIARLTAQASVSGAAQAQPAEEESQAKDPS